MTHDIDSELLAVASSLGPLIAEQGPIGERERRVSQVVIRALSDAGLCRLLIPRSLGGRTTWENVVCSCVECNRRKGGRTPAQARLRLTRRPVRPRWTPVIQHAVRSIRYDEWRPFLHIVEDRGEGYRKVAGE